MEQLWCHPDAFLSDRGPMVLELRGPKHLKTLVAQCHWFGCAVNVGQHFFDKPVRGDHLPGREHHKNIGAGRQIAPLEPYCSTSSFGDFEKIDFESLNVDNFVKKIVKITKKITQVDYHVHYHILWLNSHILNDIYRILFIKRRWLTKNWTWNSNRVLRNRVLRRIE